MCVDHDKCRQSLAMRAFLDLSRPFDVHMKFLVHADHYICRLSLCTHHFLCVQALAMSGTHRLPDVYFLRLMNVIHDQYRLADARIPCLMHAVLGRYRLTSTNVVFHMSTYYADSLCLLSFDDACKSRPLPPSPCARTTFDDVV